MLISSSKIVKTTKNVGACRYNNATVLFIAISVKTYNIKSLVPKFDHEFL